MGLEWKPITIDVGTGHTPAETEEVNLEGLSATPEQLHQGFLADLGNLQEIHDAHVGVVADNFSAVESNFDRVAGAISTTAMLNRFDGRLDEGHISLPLHGCELSGIELSETEVDGSTILKLSLSSRQGDAFEQAFQLPQGSRLATASWQSGELHLHLN